MPVNTVNPLAQPITLELANKLDNERDKGVWNTLGYAPGGEFPQEFPKFIEADRGVLLGKIKTALKDRLAGAEKKGKNLDLINSGRTPRLKGLLRMTEFRLATRDSDGKEETKGKTAIKTAGEIETALAVDIMQPYFVEAENTSKKKDLEVKGRGIPHDYDTEHGKYNGNPPAFTPNAWLPGVFLIDEIFKALLNAVDRKVKAANEAIAAFKKEDPKKEAPKDLEPITKLNDFINAFSMLGNELSGHEEADRYRRFINYETPDAPTYIKLIYADEFIVAAMVHVGDWAGGYHSSGSAIHS